MDRDPKGGRSERDAPPLVEGDFSDLSESEMRAYHDARISGLCHEGALEVALGAAPAESAAETPAGDRTRAHSSE